MGDETGFELPIGKGMQSSNEPPSVKPGMAAAPIIVSALCPSYGSYAAAIVGNRAKLRRRFPAGLFADPAFDMLLELFAAGERDDRLDVTSLSHVTGVPASTALRWIHLLEKHKLIQRQDDPADRRRTLLQLTDASRESLHSWLADISSLPLRRD